MLQEGKYRKANFKASTDQGKLPKIGMWVSMLGRYTVCQTGFLKITHLGKYPLAKRIYEGHRKFICYSEEFSCRDLWV